MNIPKHSKVIPHDETKELLESWKGNQAFLKSIGVSTGSNRSESAGIISAVNRNTREIKSAISRMPKDVYDEHGYRRYEDTVNGRVVRLDKRYKL